ncbi:MAG: transketolase C-terminal domain-containing protein, partial [candidate division WOR-3 bacterium]
NPVIVIGDGMIGQMMEPVEFTEHQFPPLPPKDWATTGCQGRKPNVINSLYLDPIEEEKLNFKLAAKYEQMKKNEVRYEKFRTDRELECLLVAYGTTARVCKTAIQRLDDEGIPTGLLRPITLFPFPEEPIYELSQRARFLLSVEMSTGQMVEDVRLAVGRSKPVYFYGRAGGMVPSPEEVVDAVKRYIAGGGR